MINETLAPYLDEIVPRSVLRALREADMVQQATASHKPGTGTLLTAEEVGRRLGVSRKAVYGVLAQRLLLARRATWNGDTPLRLKRRGFSDHRKHLTAHSVPDGPAQPSCRQEAIRRLLVE
jgi:hypothetical protein